MWWREVPPHPSRCWWWGQDPYPHVTLGEAAPVSGPQFVHLRNEKFKPHWSCSHGGGRVTEVREAGLGSEDKEGGCHTQAGQDCRPGWPEKNSLESQMAESSLQH